MRTKSYHAANVSYFTSTGREYSDDVQQRMPSLILLFYFVVLPFHWLTVFQVGAFSLKPSQLAILLLGLATLFRSEFRIPSFSPLERLVIAVYFIRLLYAAISLMWVDNPQNSLVELLRESFNFGLFVILLISLKSFSYRPLIWSLNRSFFLQITTIIGVLAGAHLLNGGVGQLISILSSSLDSLKQDFYWQGLKLLGVADIEVNGRTLRANSTNSIGMMLLVTYCYALSTVRSNLSHRILLFSGGILLVLTILASGSDRVYLLALTVSAIFIVYLTSNQSGSSRGMVLSLSAAALTATLIWVTRTEDLSTYVAQIAANPRFQDLSDVIDQIVLNPMLGAGYGSELGVSSNLGYRYPHNLILADLYFFGFIGFLLSFAWIGVLSVVFARNLKRCIGKNRRQNHGIHFANTAAMTVAIVQIQISAMGQLYLTGWTVVALALVLLDKTSQNQPNSSPTKRSSIST